METGGTVTGSINRGYLILLGVEVTDTKKDADKLCNKIVNLRIFEDENDRMNLSLIDVGGEILVVSQFTLLANVRHGRRPDFLNAAKPDVSVPLYEYFCEKIGELGNVNVQTGVFGADMKVSLINDGPVTIIIDSKELA